MIRVSTFSNPPGLRRSSWCSEINFLDQPAEQVWEWLREHGLNQWVDEVTDRKPRQAESREGRTPNDRSTASLPAHFFGVRPYESLSDNSSPSEGPGISSQV